MTTFVRRVHFSAAHTYVSSELSDEQNLEAYGSFYKGPAAGSLKGPGNTYGLGHNFKLEAHFSGNLDPLTGMIVNLADVDGWLRELLIPLDHHYLNRDIEFFKNNVPTAENIARYCFESLEAIMHTRGQKAQPRQALAQLAKVRLFEGENLWVDYSDQPLEND